jgi:hypothetical protein
MKTKKNLILSLLLIAFFGFSFGQNISFSIEESSTFGNGCIVPINVVVDSE